MKVEDLRELAVPGVVPENLRKYLLAEVHRRIQASKREAVENAMPSEDDSLAQAKNEEGSKEE